jgi:hypothetical protein
LREAVSVLDRTDALAFDRARHDRDRLAIARSACS